MNAIIFKRTSTISSLAYSLRSRLRRMEREKLWTYILTTIFVLIVYLILLQLTFPEPRFEVEKFKEIDFTRFEPPKPKAPESRRLPEKIPENAPAAVAPTNIEEIDMSNLDDIAELTKIQPQQLDALGRIASAPQDLTLPEVSVGTTTLPTPNTPVISDAAGGMPVAGAPSNVYNPRLQSSRVGYGGTGGTEYSTGPVGHGGPLADRSQANKPVEKIVVRSVDVQTMDFDRIFRELIEWMKANPVELTPSVKHYLRHKPGDLTSQVKIDAGTVTYDFMLLANEHSQDIGLLLVARDDSSNAILLRDTGFRKKSFYLSKGVAGRSTKKAVTSVSMLEENPTKEETSKFYSIFISWWNANKPQGGAQP